MKEWKQKDWIVTGVAIGILAIISIIVYLRPGMITDDAIARAMQNVLTLEDPPAYLELPEKDYWGNPLILRFSKDSYTMKFKVISLGPDGIEGTEDDRFQEHEDHNVSRAIGAGMASRAKEFFKGVKEGLESKSKYEAEKK